ncbi:MAG: transcription elongation factor GreA [Candidatus Spechtbacterales bacterium]
MEYITKKGLEQLKEELDKLKTEKTWEIAAWLREASSQGDMLENAEYFAAKEAQTALEERIEELEERIRTASVIKRRKKGVVDIGANIEFINKSSKKTTIMLVGSPETEAGEGKISTLSPLGRALIGKKVGDYVEVLTPKGRKKYKITKIA